MSVFDPECTSNYFHVRDIDPSECTGGNPYGFTVSIKVGGRSFRSGSMAWTWATFRR